MLAVKGPAGGRKRSRRRPTKVLCGFLGCIGLVVSVGGGCAAREEENAGRLSREASLLVASARNQEGTRYASALELYEEAVAKLERIVSRYPSSPLAERLARDEAEIGGYTLGALKQVVLPQMRRKAEAESSPLACALFVARAIRTPELEIPLLIRIAHDYAAIGHRQKVSELLSQTLEMAGAVGEIESRARISARIARLYAETGQFERAMEVSQGIQDSGLRVRALAEVSVGYAQAGQIDAASETLARARELADEIEEAGSRQRALAATAKGYAEIGEYGRVLEVTQGMADPDAREEALAQIAGEYRVARVSDKALKVAKTIEYFRTSALAAIAGKLAEAGRFEQAMKVVQAIEDPEDTAQALVWIAGQQARRGDTLKAGETTDLALEQARSIEDEQERAIMILWIADQYVQAGEKTDAREALSQVLPLVDRIGYFKPHVQAKVAVTYAGAGAYDRALDVARGIEEAGSRAHALIGVAGEHLDAGEREQAVTVLRESLLVAKTIQDTSAEANALAGIAGKYALAGLCDPALSLALSIGDPGLRSRVLAQVAGACAVSGSRGEAAKMLEQALMTARNLQGANAKARTLTEIAVTCGGAGQAEKALKALQEAADAAVAIEDAREKAMRLVRLADGYVGIGQDGKALATLHLALRTVLSLDDAHEKTDLLIEIAHEYLNAKVPDQAALVLARALDTAGTIPDGYDRALFLVRIANGLHGAGQKEQSGERLVQSLELAKTISNELPRARVLAEVAVQFAEAGQYERGYQVAQTISGYDASALVNIAGRYIKAGYREEAKDTLSRALELARQMENADQKGRVLLRIAEKQRKNGEERRASQVLSEASRVAGTIHQGPVRETVWGGIAGNYAELGRYEQALVAAGHIEDDEEKARILSEIALSYGKEGMHRGDEGPNLLHAIIDESGL